MLKIRLDGKYCILVIFGLAVLIRGVPELLSGPYPVGYDLLAGYAPSMLALPETFPLKLFGWLWSPLSVFILWFFWKLSCIDLLLFLKVAGPVFYGLFVSSFYYMLSKGLEWDRKKGFVTALLFLLQPGVLRIGWDQLRLMVGFVFLFVLLAKTKLNVVSGAEKRPITVAVLSVLIAVSQQLTAVLFLVVVLWQMVKARFERKPIGTKAFVSLLPFFFVFALQLYLSYFVDPSFKPSGSGFFAFTNYFLSDPRFIGGNYFSVLAYVGSLSLYVVIPLAPLALKGFFKDKVFLPMLAFLLVASYSIVVFPWFALNYYWFWTFLLPIPLTIYAGHALDRLGVLAVGKRSKKMFVGFLLLGVVAFGYASSVIRIGYPFAYTYMPSGLVESCVDFKDIPDIEEAFTWANTHIPENGLVVVPEKFQGFASMYSRFDLNIRIAPAVLSFTASISLVEDRTNVIYAVYYTDDVEYNDTELLIQFGRIGIYKIPM
jgi:hypothetical protein